MINSAVSTAKKAAGEIKKTVENEDLKKKAADLLGDAPLPFSGLSAKPKPAKSPSIQERTQEQKELPYAARRDPGLEKELIKQSKSEPELASFIFEKCILPEATFRVLASDGVVNSRVIRAFMAGKDTEGRSIVKDLLFGQQANAPIKNHTSAMIENDALFDQHPIQFLAIEDVTYLIPEEAIGEEIKMKTRNILSPVLIFNSLPQSIKVQSTNLETDGYQSLTIPGFGKKNFMYHSEHGSGIRISYSNGGKLIKHIPVEKIPFDSINVP